MISWKLIEKKLQEVEHALETDGPAGCLERLNLMLAQLDSRRPENAFGCAAILRVMSIAAMKLEDDESAGRFLSRAVELLEQGNLAPTMEQIDALLGIAECLARRSKLREAMHFAEAALQAVAADPGRYHSDELSQILGRYAQIASRAGGTELAQRAYTLALLLIHEASGVESEIAKNLLALPWSAYKEDQGEAICRVGKFLVQSLRHPC